MARRACRTLINTDVKEAAARLPGVLGATEGSGHQRRSTLLAASCERDISIPRAMLSVFPTFTMYYYIQPWPSQSLVTLALYNSLHFTVSTEHTPTDGEQNTAAAARGGNKDEGAHGGERERERDGLQAAYAAFHCC
ncbi:Hypothetical predicted protein [Scomber scombrus]|uniref:Uncharacterized protein n=1 Tax=Scomber scombrus TaxID=13677 RepID=A0AAV1PL73_SCOSC